MSKLIYNIQIIKLNERNIKCDVLNQHFWELFNLIKNLI